MMEENVQCTIDVHFQEEDGMKRRRAGRAKELRIDKTGQIQELKRVYEEQRMNEQLLRMMTSE